MALSCNLWEPRLSGSAGIVCVLMARLILVTMTSFNHYALGAVADWLHRTVAGLTPAEPGYRRLTIRPYPGGKLTHACARHTTPYGLAESSWKIMEGQMTVRVVIPPNTTASVNLPGNDGAPIEVGSGVHTWVYPYPVETI